MNYKLSLITILLLSTLHANTTLVNRDENNSTKAETLIKENSDYETKALELKGKKLSLDNTLTVEKLKREHAELLSELQKVKWEKELLAEKLELKALKEANRRYEKELKEQDELSLLEHSSKIKELETKKLTQEMTLKKAQWELKTSKLQSEIAVIEAQKKREKYVSTTPTYLDNPLRKDNSLVISDRRIPLNGEVTKEMAEEITSKINYFNNKDSKKPIFIVIDSSPGGSAMAGYLILKAMKGSEAPIYVVLRAYAASMAAIIVTLADKSFAYGHAIMLHHQPSGVTWGNLTEQKESLAHLNEWWIEFGEPIAKKMGISLDEFKKQMYEHSARGDWRELASNAQKLHWVENIIDTIVDTSILEEPKKQKVREKKPLKIGKLQETIENGKPVMYLPRLFPSDVYLLHNPDGYYKIR